MQGPIRAIYGRSGHLSSTCHAPEHVFQISEYGTNSERIPLQHTQRDILLIDKPLFPPSHPSPPVSPATNPSSSIRPLDGLVHSASPLTNQRRWRLARLLCQRVPSTGCQSRFPSGPDGPASKGRGACGRPILARKHAPYLREIDVALEICARARAMAAAVGKKGKGGGVCGKVWTFCCRGGILVGPSVVGGCPSCK